MNSRILIVAVILCFFIVVGVLPMFGIEIFPASQSGDYIRYGY